MKLCIDDANVEKIRRIYEFFPVDGVSTNPSILAKTGRPPYEVLKEIRSIVGDGELFVQATSVKAETMLEEARRIVKELGSATLVKIPCVPEGFKAMRMLKAERIRFIGTAIYTPMQGFLGLTIWALTAYRLPETFTTPFSKTNWTAVCLRPVSRTASRCWNW